jgi:DNA helicase II / ATP-dependent DNA helicase PcrA
MKLTGQQRNAVQHLGHTVITACPGSGKTRTIIAKVLRCIDELSGTPRKVACITYTNTAVHEIENRIRASGAATSEGCYEVSTIHAFCQANILGKYHWMMEAYKDGYIVLPSDHDAYIELVKEIGDRYSLTDVERSKFEELGRKPDGTPISAVIPAKAALAFWDELEKRGYIDFCNIVYHSYQLVRDNPSIAHNLSCRFAYILVDEFQDTSALQVELLALIHDVGHTIFFLVGDPEQSIYSFAGADRKLMEAFSQEIGAKGFPLSGNFRATQPLVEHAERLIARHPPMVSTSKTSAFYPSVFYEHTQDSFSAITDFFLPFLEANEISYGHTAILAQNWFVLSSLGKQLREYGIPVVGPGTRPYKRKYLLGRIAEQVCAYLESSDPEILYRTEKELFMIANELTGRPYFRIFSYKGMRVVHLLMRMGDSLRQTHEAATEWLYAVAPAFEEILIEEEILPVNYKGCLSESCDEMFAEMRAHNIDVTNMALADLGILADPRKSMKLMTMHGAKGREFEAVAIICAHDGLVPYYNYYNQLSHAGLEEARRLFYVAMTRAERALWIFSSFNNRRQPPSRFIQEIGLHVS